MRSVAVVAVVVALTSVAAAEPRPTDVAAAIAGDALAKGPIPGLSIAIVENGKPVFTGGFGKAELDNDVAATDASVYRIDSITKAFTAVAILQLAEAKKLSIDDHLSKYFPAYAHDFDPTLAQLLTHTGGLANYHSPMFDENVRLDLTAQQWVDALAKQKLFLAAPGTTWSYSNAGYDLLGLIAVKLDGGDLAHVFKQRILDPAGMTQTALCDRRAVVPHRASSYHWERDHFEHAVSWGTYGEASGGLCSSTLDLARFVQALESGKLISAASLARMRTAAVLRSGEAVDYALGTRLGHIGGARIVAYTGDGEDWCAAIVEVPARKLVVIVLANADRDAWKASRIAGEIAGQLIGVPDRLRDLDVPAALIAKLGGRWHDGDGTVVDFVVDGHHLGVQPAGAPAPARLYFQGGRTFRFGPDGPAPPLELVFDTQRTPFSAQLYSGGVFAQRNVLIRP